MNAMRASTQLVLTVAVALTAVVPAAYAQQSWPPADPLRGVVWTPPAGIADATADLAEMYAIGVTAVRVPGPARGPILTMADSLGVAVFQDLDVANVPAARLEQREDRLSARLEELLDQSVGHASAAFFGLGEGVDTSDPRACPILARLTATVKRRLPFARTYYVTHFVEDDACGGSVDFRLADRFVSTDMVDALRSGVGAGVFFRSDAGQQNAALRDAGAPDAGALDVGVLGVGALGLARHPDAGTGLVRRFTAESQARYLENALDVLLGDEVQDLAAVFVYRWRDGPSLAPASAIVRDRFGLVDSLGGATPAFRVVRGFYLGTERAFAFPYGEPKTPDSSWYVLLLWATIGVIAIAYATGPTFRQVAARYFGAHGFYREAVIEGRDVLPFVNLLLLLSASVMLGIGVAAVTGTFVRTHTAAVLMSWIPSGTRPVAAVLVESPWLLILFVACLHALWYTIWTSALSLASRAGNVTLPAQILMLIVWPLWPMLILGMIGSIIPGTAAHPRSTIVQVFVLGVVVTYLVASIRTVIDYQKVARVPWYVAAPLGLLSPLGIVLVLRAGIALSFAPELTFLRHLLLRQ